MSTVFAIPSPARTLEQRYQRLVESIKDYAIYMLTPDGIVDSWNAGAQHFKGYMAQEIIGKHFSCFYTAEDQAVGQPSLNLKKAVLNGGFECEGWRVRKDGSKFWAHCVIDPVRDEAGVLIGFAKITRDITDKKAAMDALHESEQRFRYLVEGVTDYAIYMLSPSGEISNWNAGAQHIKGYLDTEVLGTHFSRFYTEEDIAAGMPEKALETAAKEGKFEAEGWQVRKDGSRFWAHVVIDAVHDDQGNMIGFAKITRDITEKRKAAELAEQAKLALIQAEALRENESRLRQLADTIPQLAWMAGPDGGIHWYNARWYEYTGTAPADMEGWGWQSVHHPEVLPLVMARWTQSLSSGEPFQMTFPLRGADGKFRPFFTLIAPLRDTAGKIVQWFGTNTDVSPLEDAELALRKSEERLQEGLQAARMVVWDWDLQSNKVQLSSNAALLFGGSWDDPSEWWKVVHSDDVQQLKEAINRAIEERGQFHSTIRMLRFDNSDVLWVEVRGSVICNEANEPCLIRGISLDVTERTRAVEELKAADQRKDQFLAMLAHELRNPLAPISTAAQFLQMPGIPPERAQQASEIIARQASHMTSLVDDLLDVSRVTRGLITLEKEALDLKVLINSAIEQVRPLIESKRHNLAVRTAASPVIVQGDRIRLVQIVANLLMNAAKYTPQGGEISLTLDIDHGQAQLSVDDNGIGIDADLLPRVFDLFTQGERTPDRTQGGLGLGLALVKSLVALHGGTVTANSKGLDCGSTFTMILPLLEMPMVSPSSHALPSTEAASFLRLMVVDDNVDAAQTLAILLNAKGHQVSVRYDAKTVLADTPDIQPQVFILDIGLPGMDGYELARRLRSHPGTENAVLIALTGYGQAQDHERTRAAGFNHHLVKPVDMQQLVKILDGININ